MSNRFCSVLMTYFPQRNDQGNIRQLSAQIGRGLRLPVYMRIPTVKKKRIGIASKSISLKVKQSKPRTNLIGIIYDLQVAVAVFYLIPKAEHTIFGCRLVLSNIVECDEAAGLHKGRIKLKIGTDALVGMIGIDKQKIQLLIAKEF